MFNQLLAVASKQQDPASEESKSVQGVIDMIEDLSQCQQIRELMNNRIERLAKKIGQHVHADASQIATPQVSSVTSQAIISALAVKMPQSELNKKKHTVKSEPAACSSPISTGSTCLDESDKKARGTESARKARLDRLQRRHIRKER